jgi:hypothetical protein
MTEKRCKKCGTTERPKARYCARFMAVGEPCVSGACPDGEHLHLLCACGFSGIAACEDSKELGPAFYGDPPQMPADTPILRHGNLTRWVGRLRWDDPRSHLRDRPG